jgi:hypothetical protein
MLVRIEATIKNVAYSIIFITALFSFASAEEWATDSKSAYVKGSRTIHGSLAVFPFGFPIVAYEYGFHEAISGSLATGLMINPDLYVPLIGRGVLHLFNLKALADDVLVRDRLDVYIGLAAGFRLGEDTPSIFVIRECIGFRYYFTPTFGGYVEDCAGLGILNFGLSVKLL